MELAWRFQKCSAMASLCSHWTQCWLQGKEGIDSSCSRARPKLSTFWNAHPMGLLLWLPPSSCCAAIIHQHPTEINEALITERRWNLESKHLLISGRRGCIWICISTPLLFLVPKQNQYLLLPVWMWMKSSNRKPGTLLNANRKP